MGSWTSYMYHSSLNIYKQWGWGRSSTVEHLFSVCKAPGLIPSTVEEKTYIYTHTIQCVFVSNQVLQLQCKLSNNFCTMAKYFKLQFSYSKQQQNGGIIMYIILWYSLCQHLILTFTYSFMILTCMQMLKWEHSQWLS